MSPKKVAKSEGKKVAAALVKKGVKAKKDVKHPSITAPLASVATALPSSDVTYVIIDYPTENETVSGLHYAIRIGSSSNGMVELSINNGPWEACRYADGFWWYDWGYYLPGPGKISARLIDDKGKLLKRASVRKCAIV